MADPVAKDHARHDPLMIAAFVAGDADAAAASRAQALVESCEDCRALGEDLAAIVAASRDLSAWHPARPRDYRLTPAAASAARRRGLRWRLGGLLGLGDVALRRTGLGLAALGLVGILATGSSLGGAPGAAGGARTETTSDAARFGAQAAPTDAKAGGSPGSVLAPIGTHTGDTRQATPNAAAPAPTASAQVSLMATVVGVVSVLLLVAGLVLLLVPLARRRPHRS